MPPRTIGVWEILTVIGRGGIGTVYRARHRHTGEPAAVKLLGPAPAVEPTAARRLAREFEALRALDHPNVVRVYDAGVCEGYGYLAMELVEGLDLRNYLSPEVDEPPAASGGRHDDLPEGGPGPFDLEAWSLEPASDDVVPSGGRPSRLFGPDAIRAFADVLEEPETDPESSGEFPAGGGREPEDWELSPEPEPLPLHLVARLNRPERMSRLTEALEQVCDALDYVHARGLVHRDLKPSNIMVDDARRVRLMDFGLVKTAESGRTFTLSGRVVGTYRYMSPEQMQGRTVDARADLYSLGVILYELLCGRPPFLAPAPAELARAILSQPPPPVASLNPGADPRLAAVAERLLRKAPPERFQSARQVLEALRG